MKNILICCMLLFLGNNMVLASENNTSVNCSFVGTVIDAATKKPVADVMIIARGQENGDEQKFTTDQQGQYKIPNLPNGNYTIRFEKSNYKSVEKKNMAVKKPSLNSKLNIELSSEDEEGEEDHHDWLPRYEII